MVGSRQNAIVARDYSASAIQHLHTIASIYNKRMADRRSIRLQDYDYTQDGAYFVTLLTYRRRLLFGEVAEDDVELSTLGCVAEECWLTIPDHFPGVELDMFVVMPNHVHGIIVINRWETNTSYVRATHVSPLQSRGPQSGSLGAIIGSYKSAVTRRINRIRETPGAPVWQRNYYEHIMRNERSLNAIREYILHNPARWAEDEYYNG
jgi:REP element-mobilizing transposase RayT